jgi:hypothetical protein
MAKIQPETNFSRVFERFPVYFYGQIIERGWRSLVYEQGDNFYIEWMVRSFYESIVDVDSDMGLLRVNWYGEEKYVDLMLIGRTLNIPVIGGVIRPRSLVEYASVMGPACVIPKDSGIRATSVYRNVLATCQWVRCNITGTSKDSSFYASTLACVHALMTKDPHYCVVTQLFNTIAGVRMRSGTQDAVFPLPCLITQLCSTFMSTEEFSLARRESIPLEHFRIKHGFGNRVQIDWTEEVVQEDVRTVAEEELSDTTFFQLPSPADSVESRSRQWGATKRIFKLVSKAISLLSCSGEPSVDVSPQQKRGRSRRGGLS